MIRIAIDQDKDGSFALVTRPGAPAERIPITHRDAVRLMSEAAQVVLVEEGRRKHPLHHHDHRDAPPHFLDQIEG
ncbi:hypothetical protein [Xanthobacter autotrophicus]|uniref:hypothetical protein n=1 Tax=Xanthobacter autotrophicus TaxID=280 RepID=UPI00372A9FC2